METQTEFVAKRLAAHKAACADTMADPLVALAFEDQRRAAEVMARWKALRETPVAYPACSEYHYPGHGPRRQAE